MHASESATCALLVLALRLLLAAEAILDPAVLVPLIMDRLSSLPFGCRYALVCYRRHSLRLFNRPFQQAFKPRVQAGTW